MSGIRRDRISTRTRVAVRQFLTGSTNGEIGRAFQDEGFAPNPDCTYTDASERRELAQSYLEAIDWTDANHVTRALRVFEYLLEDVDPQYTHRVLRGLRRDGYELTDDGTIIRIDGPELTIESVAEVRDPAAIHELLDRIRRAQRDGDSALIVGCAKELVESTAKCILLARSLPVDDKADLPALVKTAQQALGVHPADAHPGPDSSDAVRRILGGLTSIAGGLGELRNRGYGTGHGAAGARSGLRPRHARLAVNAAVTWCELMLDTLADTDAPWRKAAS